MVKIPFNFTKELNNVQRELEDLLEEYQSVNEQSFKKLQEKMKIIVDQPLSEATETLKQTNLLQVELIEKLELTRKLEQHTIKMRRIVLENAKERKRQSKSIGSENNKIKRLKPNEAEIVSLFEDPAKESSTELENSEINSIETYCDVDKLLDFHLERRGSPTFQLSPDRQEPSQKSVKVVNLWCPSSPITPTVFGWGKNSE